MIYNIEGGVYEVNTREEEQKVYSLTDMQAIALSKYVYQLEKHYSSLYDKPISIDVEWALDGLNEKLYIIQARPETVHSQCNVHKMQQYALQDIPPVPLLTGVAVGSQISTGKVCILESMDQYTLFKEGDVLVTDMTTPDWEPIMKKSSGIITNKGGKTCHAAIVARELGVNACVGSQVATTTFTQGQPITISCADGDTAKV